MTVYLPDTNILISVWRSRGEQRVRVVRPVDTFEFVQGSMLERIQRCYRLLTRTAQSTACLRSRPWSGLQQLRQ